MKHDDVIAESRKVHNAVDLVRHHVVVHPARASGVGFSITYDAEDPITEQATSEAMVAALRDAIG